MHQHQPAGNTYASVEKETISRRQVLLLFGTHFCTLFGIAHGAAFIGFLQVMYFPYVEVSSFRFISEGEGDSGLAASGFFGFLGSLSLIVCLFVVRARRRRAFCIVGIILYLVSMGYVASSRSAQLSLLFCLPFFSAVVYGIAKPYLFRLNGWFRN